MARKTLVNKLTSVELLEKVNPENKQLLDDFMEYLESVQRSPQTISQYRSDLQIYFVWNLQHNHNKRFVDVTKRNIVAYQKWLLDENKNSPARVRRLKACLSSLSNYIENILDDEYPDFRNIINKIESPSNEAVRAKTVFESSEIQKLLDCLVEKKQYEKACILALAMYSGRRKSELTRFHTYDFQDENVLYGSLYKSRDKIKTKGRGNGKFLYCYTLKNGFQPYLELWMNYRNERGIDSDWLFPSHTAPGAQLAVSTLDSWTNQFSKVLGKDFYWHSMRHFFVTELVRAGIPSSVIVEIVGWESESMLKIYNDVPADEQFAKYFGEDGVKGQAPTSLSDL